MAEGPDDPTRPLRPAPSSQETHRETVVGADPDRLRSLQRWLAVVGVLSLAALGVGLYALLSDDEGDGRGASRQSVQDLRERVGALEDDVENRATEGTVSDLRDEQEALDQRLSELGEQAGGTEEAEQAQQAVEDLQGQVEDLQQQLEDAQQDTGGEGAP